MKSTSLYSRSLLGLKLHEKENSSINSNTQNLAKLKRQSSQITTYTSGDISLQDITIKTNNRFANKSFIQTTENARVHGVINKSQEIFVRKTRKTEESNERNFQKPMTLFVQKENPKKIPENQKKPEEKNIDSHISSIFPSILEEMNSIKQSSSTCIPEPIMGSCYSEIENGKLGKYYAKEILDVLINRDVGKTLNSYSFINSIAIYSKTIFRTPQNSVKS